MMYRQRGGSRPAHLPSSSGGSASGSGSSGASAAAPRTGFGRLFSSGNDMAMPPPSSPLSVAGWTTEPAPQPRSPAVSSNSGSFSPLLGGHVGQAPAPPPRPTKGPQQRVKKAKAYSISLLTGHAQQGSSSSTGSGSSSSNASAAAAAALPAIVEPRRSTSGDRPGRRSQEMPWIPPRSQSALGAYDYTEPSRSAASGRRHILQRTYMNDEDDDAPVHVISSSSKSPPALPPRLADASSPTFLSSLKADSLSFPQENAQPRTPGALSPSAARHLRDEPSPVSPARSGPSSYTHSPAGPPKNRRKFSVGSLLEVRSASSSQSSQSQSYDTSAPASRLKRKPPPAAVSTAYVDRGLAGSLVTPASAPLLTGAASDSASLSDRQRNYARSPVPQRAQPGEYIYREPPSPRDAPMSAPPSKRFMSPTPRQEPPSSAGSKAYAARAEQRPPARRTSTFGGLDGFTMDSSRARDSDASSVAAGGSNSGGAAVVHALGQIGGMGAAVGKRGWDLMRSWNTGPTTGLSSSSSGGRAAAAPAWGGTQGGERASLALDMNDATRKWLAVPDANATTSRAGGNQRNASGSGVFGMPLRDAVLQTSLGRLSSATGRRDSRPLSQLDALDLGSDFHVPMLSSPPMGSRPASAQHCAASREEARERYLPAVVVRCLQSLEKWGGDEEGIYRLSGRSSHTAKLRTVFDAPISRALPDLELIDIGPADLDINSVCSVLKHYLRELPEPLLTDALTPAFDEASMEAIGMPASGATAGGVFRAVAQPGPKAPNGSPSKEAERLSSTLAKAIAPLIARLPACNWYLLRELADHLADFCRASVVAKTKMPLSNLSLVLAPTLSLSVVMLRALVEHRNVLFREKGPQRDVELDGPMAAGDGPLSAPLERPRQRVPKHQAISPTGWTSSPYTSRQNSITSLESPTQDWASSRPGGNKRASILTLKGLVGGGDKRASAASVATLRGAFESGDVTQLQRSGSPTPQPARSKKTASPTTEVPSLMNDDDLADAPPIAARFVRQRTLSNASQLSMTGLTLSPPPTLAHKTSQASLVTRAAIDAYRAGSTYAGDSPRSTSGWESDTGSRRTSGESERSGSVVSTSISRPRPPTSGETHFFAKKNAPTSFVAHSGRARRGTNASSIESSASFSSNTTSTTSSPGPLASKTEMSSVSSIDSMPKYSSPPVVQAVFASGQAPPHSLVAAQEQEQHLEPYASVEERRRAWESGIQRFA